MSPRSVLPSQAELYDLRTRKITEDLPFIYNLAKSTGRKVLELACGTGRIISCLPSTDFTVWGIDIWKEALQVAKVKVPHATLVEMDMREVTLQEKFNLIILGFNGLEQLLSTDEQKKMLLRSKRHLAPGGVLYLQTTPLDISSFTPLSGPKALGTLSSEEGQEIEVECTAVRNLKTRISEVTFRYRVKNDATLPPVEDRFNVRPLTAGEVMLLLEGTGFKINNVFGDFNKNDFVEGESPTLIVIAQEKSN